MQLGVPCEGMGRVEARPAAVTGEPPVAGVVGEVAHQGTLSAEARTTHGTQERSLAWRGGRYDTT